MKKIILAAFIFSGIYFFGADLLPDPALPRIISQDRPCPFCSQNVRERQTVFTGKFASALYNYKPVDEGHLLLMPNRHVERLEDLNPEEITEILALVKKTQRAYQNAYGKNDYVLVLQNGYSGGQTVPHAHFHMIPRGKDEAKMSIKVRFWKTVFSEVTGLRSPLSEVEMEREIARLRKDS